MKEKLQDLYNVFKTKYENLSNIIFEISSKLDKKEILSEEEYVNVQNFLQELKESQVNLFKQLSNKLDAIYNLNDIEQVINLSSFNDLRDTLLNKLSLLKSENLQNQIYLFKDEILNMEVSAANLKIINVNINLINSAINNDIYNFQNNVDDVQYVNHSLFTGLVLKAISIINECDKLDSYNQDVLIDESNITSLSGNKDIELESNNNEFIDANIQKNNQENVLDRVEENICNDNIEVGTVKENIICNEDICNNNDAIDNSDMQDELSENIDKYEIDAIELLTEKGFAFSSTNIDDCKIIKKEKKNFNKSSFAKSINSPLSSSYARILDKLYLNSFVFESEIKAKNDILVLHTLYNEGYLAKYKFDEENYIYFLTKIGCEIYTVSQVRSLIKRVTKTTVKDNKFNYKDYYNKDKEKLEADYTCFKLYEIIGSYITPSIHSTINPFHIVLTEKEETDILYIILSNSNFTYGDFSVFKEIDDIDKIVCIAKSNDIATRFVEFFKEFTDRDIYYALYDKVDSYILNDVTYSLESLYEVSKNSVNEVENINNEDENLNPDNDKEVNEVASNIELLEENKQELIESIIIKIPTNNVEEIDFENSSSAVIASYIKKTNNFTYDVMTSLVNKLLEEDKLFTALEILKCLSTDDEKYSELYNCLKCALGKTTHGYDSSLLAKYFTCIYEETSNFNISCFISTMMRILFSPIDAYDYNFKPWYEKYTTLDPDLQFYSKIKNITNILNNVITNIDNKGFSSSNLRQFKETEGLNNELDIIIAKANEIKNYRKTFTFPDKGLFAYVVGDKSPINDCVKWIRENDLDKLEKSKEIYNRFVSNSVVDDDLIRNYINDNNLKIKNPRALTDKNEKEVIREIKHRLEIIENWINFNSNNVITNNNALKLAKESLFKAIHDYLDNVAPSPENNIIKYTLNNIVDAFSDEIKFHKDIKEFLLTDYVVLNDDLSVCEKDLPHYQLINRLIDHIIDNGNILINDKNILEKLEYNLNDIENLGFVYSLKLYIESNKLNTSFDFSEIDNYKESYDSQIKYGFQEIINTINLDNMYGRINEEDCQDLYSEIEVAKKFFANTFNLGLFKKYKKILENYRKQLMISIHNDYCKRLLALIEDKSLDEYLIINDIFKVIKENNYTVAEEYMTLLANGQKDINREHSPSEDFFGEYNRIYDLLYDLLENNKVRGKNISGNDYLLNQLTKIAQNELNIEKRRKSTMQANNMLNCWINSPDQFSSKNDIIKKIFQELQFDVDGISNVMAIKELKYKDLKLRKVGKQLFEYLHPISEFGTNIPDNIRVVYLDGHFTAKDINNRITKEFKYDGLTIVLLNGYLSKLERNKLAHEFKTGNSLQHKYIVIDRLLFCFLAMIEKSERQKAFVNCTLPYSYVQPFVETGSGRIPDEMFFGRVQELNSIMDIDKGAILVYGGRQLGKTALLQRVQNLMMKHHEKSYTIYLSIQNIKNSQDLLKALIDEMLLLNNLFGKTIIISDSKAKKINSWSDFAENIRVSYARDNFKKLYILLDEVDKFIQEQENEGYNVINELIKLKDDSTLHGKFKFVLAGLHNVVKYVHKDNDSLRKLGAPLCIKPLPTVDARRFIIEPLSTIGYKFSNEENQISMILSKLNYYPGLLHIFCSRIINDSNANFRHYYNNIEKVPPYLIDEKTLGKFLTNNEINTEANKKLIMTLDLNGSLYMKIACAISFLYETENKQQGVSIKDLIPFFSSNPPKDKIKSLLEEMIELGILRKSTNDSNLYVYRKYSFHKSVFDEKGNIDEVWETAITDYEI